MSEANNRKAEINKNFRDYLKETPQKIILWDGGFGTMLFQKGLDCGEIPDIWNIKRPDVVADIHNEYIIAGSDVIQTNTFGANRTRLQKKGLAHKIKEINKIGVQIARECAGDKVFIAGDIGPTGEFFPQKDFKEIFYEQASILTEEGVDLLHIETMFNLEEALFALDGCKKLEGVFIAVSITYKRTKKGYFTEFGNSVSHCVKKLQEHGADMIGANCTLTPSMMGELSEIICSLTKLPVIVQPNAGNPEILDGRVVYQKSPLLFVEECERILNSKIRAIGGCCGTTPEHIFELRKRLDANLC